MTKELLEDYPHICFRIRELQKDKAEGKEVELAALLKKRRLIEHWVNNLTCNKGPATQREKNLVAAHALKGMGWKVVCREQGYRSPDAARVAYDRILKKYL